MLRRCSNTFIAKVIADSLHTNKVINWHLTTIVIRLEEQLNTIALVASKLSYIRVTDYLDRKPPITVVSKYFDFLSLNLASEYHMEMTGITTGNDHLPNGIEQGFSIIVISNMQGMLIDCRGQTNCGCCLDAMYFVSLSLTFSDS